MTQFLASAPLLFRLLIMHYVYVCHYYIVVAHHMYNAPLVFILSIVYFPLMETSPQSFIFINFYPCMSRSHQESNPRPGMLLSLLQPLGYMPFRATKVSYHLYSRICQKEGAIRSP